MMRVNANAIKYLGYTFTKSFINFLASPEPSIYDQPDSAI